MLILIADDFESEINLVKEVLNDLGYTNILSAYNGAEAVRLLGEHKIDVVITDYNMPFKNGGEVVDRALRLGIKKVLLRSSHSVATLKQKLAGIGIESGVAIMCKRDSDKHDLKQVIVELVM